MTSRIGSRYPPVGSTGGVLICRGIGGWRPSAGVPTRRVRLRAAPSTANVPPLPVHKNKAWAFEPLSLLLRPHSGGIDQRRLLGGSEHDRHGEEYRLERDASGQAQRSGPFP